eukprot:gnl/MRDRNA2_/MRDRNA2_79763_c0_seq1.p1 gnl/MRDRNA2_/MRDRNA2_79763_c0~~gnl/MRDRNA2_/MRDRNA2_79763_c0_seq1.p1  ORF type:complete len:646 (+),score=79.78 gnl/MRDRNA2_/MRDRNA2_79763_c0_seq1:121-2058(+)
MVEKRRAASPSPKSQSTKPVATLQSQKASKPSKPSKPPEDATVDLLTVWTRLYAIHQIMFQKRYYNHGQAGPWADDFELLGLLFIVPAFFFPTLPAAFSAHLFYVCLKCWRCPFQYNSDVWCTFVDLGFCISAFMNGWKVYIKQQRRSLSQSERNAVVRDAAASARPMLGFFYLGAGLWKHNNGHMSRQTSCSTVYMIMALQEWLPEDWVPEGGAIVQIFGTLGGPLGALTEDLTGIFMLLGVWYDFARRGAVLLGILLHLFITLVPGVGVPSFSVAMVTRFFYFQPDTCAKLAAYMTAVTGSRLMFTAAVACLAMYFGAGGFGTGFGGGLLLESWSITLPLSALRNSDSWVFLGLSCFAATAAFRPEPTESPGTTKSKAFYPLVALAAAFSFLFIPLGLQDMGNVHMFANLHVGRPGAGNHHFLPSSLLQDYAVSAQASAATATRAAKASGDKVTLAEAEATERAAAASAFAGGVVRIDKTNASFGQIYPGEMPLPDRAVKLLKSIGHSGRMFVPLATRIHGNSGLLAGHMRYTFPALELRRLIAAAKAEKTSFVIEYANLPTTGYDLLNARDPALPKVFYSWNAVTREVTCIRGGKPCPFTEPSLQPWPPPGLLGLWAAKVIMHYPAPVIDDHPWPGVPCHDA